MSKITNDVLSRSGSRCL